MTREEFAEHLNTIFWESANVGEKRVSYKKEMRLGARKSQEKVEATIKLLLEHFYKEEE